jgi:hypothetical protein
MKKALIVFSIISGITSCVFAQTNTFPSSGSVGIGTTPNNLNSLDVRSIQKMDGTWTNGAAVTGVSAHSTGDVSLAIGLVGMQEHNGSGTLTHSRAIEALGRLNNGGNITNSSAFWGKLISAGTSTITNGYGVYIDDFPSNVTNKYGVYINDATARNYFAGNVGIGTTTPSEKLTLQGNMLLNGTSFPKIQLSNRLMMQVPMSADNNWTRSFVGQNVEWNGTTSKWSVNDQTFSDFSMIRFENGGTISFYNRVGTGTFPEMTTTELEAYKRMTIDYSGNVGIGTTTPQSKLAVNGDIFSKKVKVTQTGWADYVFNDDYPLLPLNMLEKYIQQHKHLPDVASATEVEKNGLDLGDNQVVLLKKIEELTLYIIELKKENERINEKMEKQQQEIQSLKENKNSNK